MLRSTGSANLFDFLLPHLRPRARHISLASSASATKTSSKVLCRRHASVLHSTLREQILGQGPRRAVPESSKKKHNHILSNIKMSLQKQDAYLALTNWTLFRQERAANPVGDLYQLPEQTERQLASLLRANMKKLLSGKHKEDTLRFAFQAASHDIADALEGVMMYHLDRKDPQEVISIYHEYLRLHEKENESSTRDQSLLFEDDEDPRSHSGRADLLHLAIVAHAMDGTFADAFRTHQMANVFSLPHHKTKSIQCLRDDRQLQGKVQDFTHRLGIASRVARPMALTKHISNLSHPKTVRILQQFYNDVLDGIRREDPYLAIDPTQASPDQAAMTEAGWTAFQTGFIRCERSDLADTMWKDLEGCGFTPGTAMWTGLLDAFADLRDSTQAMRTWNHMLEHGIKPDSLSYRAMISALFDDNKATEALQRFREYHSAVKDPGEYALSVYNTVLRGLLRINRIADALVLLRMMSAKGPKPDIITHNTFLGYYSRQKDFKGISEVIGRMADAELPGDVVTFSTILTALLSVGRKDATGTILNIMRKQGIEPNVATYTAIIDQQMREDTAASVKAALSILDKMEQSERTKPNEVTYTSILSGLYRNPSLPRPEVERIKQDIVARMRQNQVSFRLPTYHILIRAAMYSPDPEGHVDALAHLEEMRAQNIPVTTTAWYLILAGLMHRQLWDVANEIVDKIMISDHDITPRQHYNSIEGCSPPSLKCKLCMP